MKQLLVIVLTLLTAGCISLKKDIPQIPKALDPIKIENTIQDSATDLSINNSKIKAKALDNEICSELITRATKIGKEKSPEIHEWKTVERFASTIKDNSIKQQNYLKNNEVVLEKIAEINYELNKLKIYLKEVEESNKTLIKQNKDLRKNIGKLEDKIENLSQKASQQNQKIWMGVMGFCALLLVGGIIATVYGLRKLGIGAVAAALIIAPIAYFMSTYAWVLAIIGGFLLIIFFGVLLYIVYEHREALVESITSLEITKHKKWGDVKEDVKKIQSHKTKKLVNKYKVEKVNR